MDPLLWGTLPEDLLVLVLARLSLRKMNRVRCLSKKWQRELATVNSQFNRACAQAHPNMAALIWYAGYNQYLAVIIDIRKHTWEYCYSFSPGESGTTASLRYTSPEWRKTSIQDKLSKWLMMDACNDGLVCFVSMGKRITKADPLRIVLMNPLTGVHRKLPPFEHSTFTIPPTLVHVKVNSEAKCYEVFVADRRRCTVERYDSSLEQWTRAASSHDFSFIHARSRWGCHGMFTYFPSPIPTLCMYDSEKQHLELLSPIKLPKGASMKSYALDKSRMFVLQHWKCRNIFNNRFAGVFEIIEYHAQNSVKDWVQVRTVPCPPTFVELAKMGWKSMDLHTCEGSLVLTFRNSCLVSRSWLLDLTTHTWFEFLPYRISDSQLDNCNGSLMCKAQWNLFP